MRISGFTLENTIIVLLLCFLALKVTKISQRELNEFIHLKLKGQLYQYINNLLPEDQHPRYLQLYFYDHEVEIDNLPP